MFTRGRASAFLAVFLTSIALTGCSAIEQFVLDSSPPGGSEFSTAPPRAPSTPATPQAPVAPEPSAPGGAAGGYAECAFTDAMGESRNAELTAVVRDLYARVDCSSPQSLEAQLSALRGDAGLAHSLQDSGWMLDWGSSTDSSNVTTHQLVVSSVARDGSYEACSVAVSDAPRSKMLVCLDEGTPTGDSA